MSFLILVTSLVDLVLLLLGRNRIFISVEGYNERRFSLDVANGANSQKLVEYMRRMCDLYDRPCLIIEKDRVKPGETEKHLWVSVY